ncbi:MAG: hypothetical protein DME73_06985 [Verrucomicrobia bacterium]|nr:MAG: hypothetical protein DME73_06985 [Verrucomicrobiota bacterium]
MRHFLVIVLIGLASSAFGATLQMPTENRVIIPGHWRPSGGYMDVALRCAAWFLEHPDVSDANSLREIALIRQHAREYRVQFIGTFRNGQTVLLCNFFPAPKPGEKQDPYSYWRSRRVEAKGGGFWFWRLEFDNAVGRCTNFAVNSNS